MRSQLSVLKKAVIDEQNKNADLSDALRMKETMLRKSEAEMESLVFRNQQLTRRVEIFQDEEEKRLVQNKKGKKHHGGLDRENAASEIANVFSEELHVYEL